MAKSLTISTTAKDFSAQLEFKQLRELGMKHISNLSGKIWTDHNLHDPGITILEVLSYAITDLAYRQNLDIEDLLTKAPGSDQKEDNFFTAAQILTCNPLTIEDYRKMLIDIDGIKNAWLEIANENEEEIYVNCPADPNAEPGGNLYTVTTNQEVDDSKSEQRLILNGLYKIYLELESIRPQDKIIDDCGDEQMLTGRILTEVNKRLHQHRNLSEDFLEVIVLEEEQIGLCADLELAPSADPEAVMLDVLKKVQQFLSPNLPFYTLNELLDKGKTPEEAFAGRPLIMEGENICSHGFIDIDELENLGRKTEIYVSDLYRVILQDERIRAVKNLYVLNYREGVALSEGEEWCLKISERHCPVLAPELSRIKFFKGVIPLSVNFENIRVRYEEKLSDFGKVLLHNENLDLPIPKGQYRGDLGDYYSIQRDFPMTYMVGERQVPDNATSLRKAQAKQLKGYLLFFDQLLADYLSQLTHIRDLFSMQRDEKRSEEKRHTFFPESLKSVPHVEDLIQYFDEHPKDQNAIAKHPMFYNSPTRRSEELRKTIRDFQKTSNPIDIEKIGNDFKYLIKNESGNSLLESVEIFKSEAKAREKAEEILILAGEEQSYRLSDRPSIKEYSFEFFYNPVLYADFIKKIAESPTKYFQRRNQFLDHLLGRFSEQFNDYVLLMYALNGKENEPEKIIDDKTDFLINYPNISRNRARAFDYSNAQEIWNTDNVTGLEKKVAKLLGIKNANRTYLNNFELVKRETQYYFQYLDHRGQILVQSENSFASEAEALAAGGNFINQLGTPKNGIDGENVDCLTEQIFSFKIQNKNSKLNTIHPYGYSGDHTKSENQSLDIYSKIRDSKKSFTKDLIAGKGIVTKLNALQKGYYFFLYNDAEQVQLISSQNYQEEDLAWKDWLLMIDLASDASNYIDTSDAVKKGFGFEIGLEENGIYRALAKNPVSFKSKGARTTARKKIIKYLQTKQSILKTEQAPSSFSWEMKNSKELLLLKSVVRFKTAFQTAAAYYYLMQIVLYEENYFLFETDVSGEKKYGFLIGESGEYEDISTNGTIELQQWQVDLAESPIYFDSTENREKYLQALKKQLKKKQSFEQVILTDHSAWTYELMNDEGERWMQSIEIFPNRKAANKAWEQFLSLAGKRENFELIGEEGFLKQGIAIVRKGEIIAKYVGETFENEKKAEVFIDQVIDFVKSGKAVFSDRLSEAFYTEINHPLTGRKIRSAKTFRSKVEALFTYDAMIKAARDGNNYHSKGKKKDEFTFDLKTKSGDVIGRSEPYMFKSDREDAIENFCTFANKTTPFYSIEEHAGRFNFQISDKDAKVGLQSVLDFECEFEAKKMAWSLSKKATNPDHYKNVKSEDGCQFSFHFHENEETETVTAVHLQYYSTKDDCNQKRNNLIDFIGKNCVRFDIAQKFGTWYFEILWENCAGNCETLFKDTAQYGTMLEAKEAFDKWWKEVVNGSDILPFFNCKKVTGKNTYTIFFEIVTTDDISYLLNHPASYKDKESCLAIIQDACAYLAYAKQQQQEPTSNVSPEKVSQTTEKGGATFKSFPSTFKGLNIIPRKNKIQFLDQILPTESEKENEIEKQDYGFRLTGGKEPIAIHPHRYENEEQRDFVFTNLQAKPVYSTIKMNGVSGQSKEGFYFSIIETAKVPKMLWQSADYFNSRAEADAAFQGAYLEIIDRSRDKGAYYIKELKQGYRLELRNENGDPVAIHPHCFDKKSEAQIALQYRRKWALLFPVLPKGKYFGFQIYNSKNQKIDWQSKRLFYTVNEAIENFNKFIALQSYIGNFRLINEPEACIFGVELREVLLESEGVFTSPENAWTGEGLKQCHGLNDLLRAIQEENGVYPYFDPHKDCRFSFNVVHPKYQLLKHTKSYLLLEDRERARDHLFAQHQCGNIVCTEIDFAHTCIRMEYHGVLKNNETQQKLWRSAQSFTTDSEALEHIETISLDLLIAAREFDYYMMVKEEGGIRLSLTDDKNNVLAIAMDLYPDLESVRKAIYDRILFARQYPFTPTEDGVIIELYCKNSGASVPENPTIPIDHFCPPEEQPVEVPGTIVWKSILDYPSLRQAKCDIELIKELLSIKSNYQRPDRSNCGPFTIELTDPNKVLAVHPRYYVNRNDLMDGMAHTLSFVNREGFHLVEHILLRPREGQVAETNQLLDKIPICLEQEICECVEWGIPENEQAIMDNYLPGADPFSFWVSIVIPFWPKRFQSQNFRTFFENTLRREIPAHIAIRICWVSPGSLHDFEDKYRNWLTALSGAGACNFHEAQCEVLEELFDMRNVYDPATLHDCDDEITTNDVYLDQTKL